MQICSERAARSLKLSSPVAYAAQVVWLSSTEGKRKFPADHSYTLLRSLPVEVVEHGKETRDPEKGKSVFKCNFTSSDAVCLENLYCNRLGQVLERNVSQCLRKQ